MAIDTSKRLEQLRADASLWAGFLSIKTTWAYVEFLRRHEKTIFLATGNQWGKNVNIIKHYIMRWLGMHPIEEKNMRPNKDIRMYRFCSETLPYDNEGQDRNTIYPVLKKMLPKWMIKRDLTQRKPIMTLLDPQGGPDIYVEFVSYGQDVQTQAGVQRASVYIDENCSKEFYMEQLPRLIASDGDIIIGMTPALGQVTWQYEELYEKASTYVRTPKVCKRLRDRFNETHELIESTDNDSDTCVVMAATDDNPYYDGLVKEKNARDILLINAGKHHLYKSILEFTPITKSAYIEEKIGFYDEETEDVRRYGIFRQVSGRIFKDFDSRIHVLSGDKYFPDGMPHNYLHARGVDYHEHVAWHTGFICISPEDEAFIYDEVVMSPERYVTMQIARAIADRSGDIKYTFSKIDPLAAKKQSNTGLSTIDDLNRLFYEFRREGIGMGGYWTAWDTKSTRGREEIRKRLKNSRLCGKPFNNTQMVNGRTVRLPTIWVLNNCHTVIDSMKNWRLEEWDDRKKLETKEMKETPLQRYSHICMVFEALFKEAGFKARSGQGIQERRHTANNYGRS